MDQEQKKKLQRDPDGLLTYEYLANHIGDKDLDIDFLIENMILVDSTGQFMISAARYLNAIDPERFKQGIDRLVAIAIDRDRERRYIADLLPAIWGEDYARRAENLMLCDDNFRRIWKRVTPTQKL